MKRSLRDDVRFATRRRGVTLVEMLVTLAILLLMMTAIVQIFQAATGALNSAQAYQELDNQLRLLDSTIRSDLNGVTCKLTPPNNPQNNPGYLEYGENEFADVQGEDSRRLHPVHRQGPRRPAVHRADVGAAAELGQLYRAPTVPDQLPQPITITSEYAEIIYFLRNGNLYRRVLLVAPERQSTIEPTIGNNVNHRFGAGFFPSPWRQPGRAWAATTVSWQGVNDLSAHPATSRSNAVPRQLGRPQHPGRPDQPREPVCLPAVRQRLPGNLTGAAGPGRPDRRLQRRQRARLLPDALSRRTIRSRSAPPTSSSSSRPTGSERGSRLCR